MSDILNTKKIMNLKQYLEMKETDTVFRSRIAKICQSRPEVRKKKSVAMKAYWERMNHKRDYNGME